MDIVYFRHKKTTCVFLVLLALLYTLFGIANDFDSEYDRGFLHIQYGNHSSIVDVDEFDYSDSTIQSSTQAVFGRQLKCQKRNTGLVSHTFLVRIWMPALFLVFLIILNLFCFVRNCSDRFIIWFIHNKDGKKA